MRVPILSTAAVATTFAATLGITPAVFVALTTPAMTALADIAAPAPSSEPRTAFMTAKRAARPEERRYHYRRGIEAARALLARNPDDPEGLLWLAANLGSEALERGKLAALRVVPEVVRLLLRLDQTSPLHDHAAAARGLASIYFKAPPLISVGSNDRARLYFEKALQRAPEFPANQILAAEFFADRGEHDRARALASRYLRAPADPRQFPDAPAWLKMAQEIAATGR